MNHFRPIDRDTGLLMPPSVDEWLPERHLARFVVEVVAGRQFLLRGIDGARGEWSLVTMAWNMKRMFVLAAAP